MNHEEEYNVEGYDHAFSSEPLFTDYPEPGHAGHAHGAQPGYEHEAYAEGADEEENFPEPAAAKEKKQVSRGMMAAVGGLAAVVIGLGCAYIYDPDMVTSGPSSLIAMVTGGSDPASEPAPEPAVAKPHKQHPKPNAAAAAAGDQTAAKQAADATTAGHPHHTTASKPAAVDAAKPAEDAPKAETAEFKAADAKAADKHATAKQPTSVAAVPPKPVATKPKAAAADKPVAKPKVPTVAAKPAVVPAEVAAVSGVQTSIGFAPGSYWVAASEIENLWAYTSRLKANSGQFTVESWVSNEADGLNLSRKRANRVAELLSKNTPAHSYKVTVKVHGAPAGKVAARKVSVSFSSKL